MRNAIRAAMDWNHSKKLAADLWGALKQTPTPGAVDVSKFLTDDYGRSSFERDAVASAAIMRLQKLYPNALTVVRNKKNLTLIRTADFDTYLSKDLKQHMKQSGNVVTPGTDLVREP